jgi:hypothetical protein
MLAYRYGPIAATKETYCEDNVQMQVPAVARIALLLGHRKKYPIMGLPKRSGSPPFQSREMAVYFWSANIDLTPYQTCTNWNR